MSSDKECEKHSRRKSKGSSRKANPPQGEPAPKARPKGVVDGNLVNIPGPGGGDEWCKTFWLIGLFRALKAVPGNSPVI